MYRMILVTERLTKTGTQWTWQASYTADSIPDTQAILALDSCYRHISVWDTAAKRWVE